MKPETFNYKFKGSPVKRAERRGYLRNVAVALGNSGDLDAVPALTWALQDDPEPLVRVHAAWALRRVRGDRWRSTKETVAYEHEKILLSRSNLQFSKLRGSILGNKQVRIQRLRYIEKSWM